MTGKYRYQIDPYSVRMPEALREALEKSGKENGRSLHAEILFRLRDSLENSGIYPPSDPVIKKENKKLSTSTSINASLADIQKIIDSIQEKGDINVGITVNIAVHNPISYPEKK